MKKGFLQRMPDFTWQPAGSTFNTGVLAPAGQSFHGFIPRESERLKLPALHTYAGLNAAAGFAPATSPAPLDTNGFPLWFYDATDYYFGKAGWLVRPPRCWLIGGLTPWYSLCGSASDRQALAGAHVLAGNRAINSGVYNGWLLAAVPWLSPMPTGDLGGPAAVVGNLPSIDPTQWEGGELLLSVEANTGYYEDASYVNFVDGSLFQAALWNSDLAQLLSALPKFSRLAIRAHANLGRPGEDAFFQTLVGQAAGQGIDISYTNGTLDLASIRADYVDFWGL